MSAAPTQRGSGNRRGEGTVLMTGSSLIGSAVIRRLADRFTVVGYDREGPPHPPPMAECVCVDVRSDESVREGLERVRFVPGERTDSVTNLAAHKEDPERWYRGNKLEPPSGERKRAA